MTKEVYDADEMRHTYLQYKALSGVVALKCDIRPVPGPFGGVKRMTLTVKLYLINSKLNIFAFQDTIYDFTLSKLINELVRCNIKK